MTDQTTKIARTILTHLKQSGQLGLLSQVVDVLRKSSEYQNSQNRVVVTSAVALDQAELSALKRYLDKSLGKSYDLTKQLDPNLLAGFTLQVNDTFIDASVLGKINTVSNNLIAKD